MRKIFTILLIGVFLLNLASASLQDNFEKDVQNASFQLTEKECSSVQYKMFSPFLRGFIFEVETINTNEHFFIVIREKNCFWYAEVLDNVESEADIVLIGNFIDAEEDFSPIEIQKNTIKGKFLGGLAKDVL